MKSRILVGLAASAAAIAVTGGTAMADPMMPMWSGFYVGANAGVIDAMTTHSNQASNDFAPFVPGARYNLDSTGALGGGQAGFNFQFSHIVLGVEGDLDGIAGANTQASTPASGDIFGVHSSHWNALGTARGRIGFAFDNCPVMIYGTGGLAFGDVKNTAANVFTGGGVGATWARSGWRTGWTVGGGGEWMFAPNWSLKAEVLYVDLGSYSTTGNTGGDPSCRQGFSNTAVIGRAGVNLHF